MENGLQLPKWQYVKHSMVELFFNKLSMCFHFSEKKAWLVATHQRTSNLLYKLQVGTAYIYKSVCINIQISLSLNMFSCIFVSLFWLSYYACVNQGVFIENHHNVIKDHFRKRQTSSAKIATYSCTNTLLFIQKKVFIFQKIDSIFAKLLLFLLK